MSLLRKSWLKMIHRPCSKLHPPNVSTRRKGACIYSCARGCRVDVNINDVLCGWAVTFSPFLLPMLQIQQCGQWPCMLPSLMHLSCSIIKVQVRGWLQRLGHGSYPGFYLRKFPLLRQYVTRLNLVDWSEVWSFPEPIWVLFLPKLCQRATIWQRYL